MMLNSSRLAKLSGLLVVLYFSVYLYVHRAAGAAEDGSAPTRVLIQVEGKLAVGQDEGPPKVTGVFIEVRPAEGAGPVYAGLLQVNSEADVFGEMWVDSSHVGVPLSLRLIHEYPEVDQPFHLNGFTPLEAYSNARILESGGSYVMNLGKMRLAEPPRFGSFSLPVQGDVEVWALPFDGKLKVVRRGPVAVFGELEPGNYDIHAWGRKGGVELRITPVGANSPVEKTVLVRDSQVGFLSSGYGALSCSLAGVVEPQEGAACYLVPLDDGHLHPSVNTGVGGVSEMVSRSMVASRSIVMEIEGSVASCGFVPPGEYAVVYYSSGSPTMDSVQNLEMQSGQAVSLDL